VANITDQPMEVPMIRVTLFDANGDEVQHAVSAAKEKMVEPAKNISFTAKIKDPSPLARRLEVTFTRPPEMKEMEKTDKMEKKK